MKTRSSRGLRTRDHRDRSQLQQQMSGGELQLAALVRQRSRICILICDEITSGFDASTRTDLMEVLDQIQEETGCVLVLISHELGVVATFTRAVQVDAGDVTDGPWTQCSS